MKKIKVVFLINRLVCGGAEKALFDLILLMDREKFDIKVFVQRPGYEWDSKFIKAGIELVYDYSCRKPTWNPIKKLGNLRKKLEVRKSLKNQGAGLLDICCPGADIVVDFFTWDYDEMPFAKGAKTVKYIHGNPGNWPAYGDEVRQKRAHMDRFDRIICVSQDNCQAFREISGMNEKVQAYYNPLNSQQVRVLAQESAELPEDAPILCAVGRLAEQKAFERLVLIHKSLLLQGIRQYLVIVGDGPDRNFLERLVRATGTQDTVILAGYQSNPYPYMKKSKFLVSSSLYEGLPVIAMEGLSLGIPIVAPIPSVAEIFGEEPCGLITDNSMEALEAGIKRMLTDEECYARTKQAAENRSAYFDGRRMAQEVEAMLLAVLEEKT